MRFTLILGSFVIAIVCSALGQESSSWSVADPGFRPVNVTATRAALWTCGVGEGIASSTDAQHWQVKHHVDSGGALLLGMGFTSDTFGYAYGTSGTVLTTTDGGSTWSPQKFGTDTILQASFADAGHGLIRTQAALSYLNGDGTLHAIHEPADVLQRFPYTASLVALTPEKMAVLLSQGTGFGGRISNHHRRRQDVELSRSSKHRHRQLRASRRELLGLRPRGGGQG